MYVCVNMYIYIYIYIYICLAGALELVPRAELAQGASDHFLYVVLFFLASGDAGAAGDRRESHPRSRLCE